MKYLKIGLAVLLLSVVTGFIVLLLPAHMQVRSVNTPLPVAADFQQLQRADGPSAIYFINTAEQQLPQSILAHSAVVLEWADGSLFLIDAGMRRAQAEEFGKLIEQVLDGGKIESHGTIAELLGDDLARLAGVGFTHLHIDHTEGIIAVCESEEINPILLQTEFQREKQNFNTTEGAAILASSCLTPGPIAGDPIAQSERFPGLGMVAVGGHTPGSTLFAAWLNGQLYLFSGDITNTKNELLQDLGKGWVYSNLLVPEDTTRTREMRQWLARLGARADITIIVSHDLADIRSSGLPEF